MSAGFWILIAMFFGTGTVIQSLDDNRGDETKCYRIVFNEQLDRNKSVRVDCNDL